MLGMLSDDGSPIPSRASKEERVGGLFSVLSLLGSSPHPKTRNGINSKGAKYDRFFIFEKACGNLKEFRLFSR